MIGFGLLNLEIFPFKIPYQKVSWVFHSLEFNIPILMTYQLIGRIFLQFEKYMLKKGSTSSQYAFSYFSTCYKICCSLKL